jgi:hypothetical protein
LINLTFIDYFAIHTFAPFRFPAPAICPRISRLSMAWMILKLIALRKTASL